MYKLLLVFILVISSGICHANVTVTSGSGSAVTTIDRMATFDSINSNGIDLSSYSENLLDVTVDDISFVDFDAFNDGVESEFHYGSGRLKDKLNELLGEEEADVQVEGEGN